MPAKLRKGSGSGTCCGKRIWKFGEMRGFGKGREGIGLDDGGVEGGVKVEVDG